MRCSLIVAPILAAIAVVGIARAQTGGESAPVDPARLSEKYVIPPNAEPLFSGMLGSGQTLPGGCTFGNGQIERTSVLATYACGGGQVELQLLHPESAPRGAVRTERFAIAVKSGVAPAGLVEAIAERVRAREAPFQWTAAPDFGRGSGTGGGGGGSQTSLVAMVAAGAALAFVLFWALRRRSARRR